MAEQIGAEELYRRNGLQDLPFTTLFQLAADEGLGQATSILLIPDLVAAILCGNGVAERTNASTTGLLDVRTREWDSELMVRLGLDVGLFAELVDPGHEIGALLPHVAEGVGGQIAVVAVASHDTASAVVGVPMQGEDAAYVSLGTWALVGLELDEPIVTEEARLASFTNEGGVDGTVRFLSNVMGTWLLSETLRTWGETDLAGLLRAAEAHDVPVPIVDVQHPSFLPPGDMEAPYRGLVRRARRRSAERSGGGGAVHRREHRRGHRVRPRSGVDVGRPPRRCRPRRRRRCPEHAVVPGDRRPERAAGAGRARRGDGPGQRARAGPRSRPGRTGPRGPARAGRPHPRLNAVHPARPERIDTVRVALMVTCINDALFPDTGRAVVTLLRRLASRWTSRTRRRAAGSR